MTTEYTLLNNFQINKEANSIQQKAFDRLTSLGLPNKKSELYKYTPITSILDKNIDWSANAELEVSPIKNEAHIILINGVLSEKSNLTEGINVEIVEISEGENDTFSLMNTAFASQEIKISCSLDTVKIFVSHYSTNAFSNPRIKVSVQANQVIDVYERIHTPADLATFTNSYISFDVANNGIGNLTKIQNYNNTTYTHESIFAHVARDAKFYTNTYSFKGALIRNNITINLEDENCEGHMNGVFLLDGNSHVDNNTSVDHQKPNCYSNELYKGILDEKSTGIFNGKIYVRQDAQKTNAFQSNNNILLSDDATLHTKPQLEIWADDVKCSHGCTSGQLNEDAVFYLRARGIDEKSAKGLLLNAFAGEALEELRSEAIKEEIQQLISDKLI